MKIVIDCDIPYIKGVLEPYADIFYVKGDLFTPKIIENADALIIRTRTKCDEELLRNSKVGIIATATIGYDHIDIDYCREKGIKIATSAGSNARGVLQWVAASLVHASEKQGWEPRDKSLGIVGVGHVGSLVEYYATKWGFNVFCCDPPRAKNGELALDGKKFTDLQHLVRNSDIITFHTPLLKSGIDATFHMANCTFFDNLTKNTLILNSSRGEVVDTAELKKAISYGKCTAIIDTWENEPRIDGSLLESTILGTPHIAGYTVQGKANATAMCVRSVAGELGFPLIDWYPSDIKKQVLNYDIDWKTLKSTIKEKFDISTQSNALKKNPGDFEKFRNGYRYREEYF